MPSIPLTSSRAYKVNLYALVSTVSDGASAPANPQQGTVTAKLVVRP